MKRKPAYPLIDGFLVDQGMLSFFGFSAALLIGVSLGMLGAGGAILTIPVLVYLFQIPPKLATTYSLFIVGISSFAGSIGYIRNRLLNIRTAMLFGLASIFSIFVTRSILFPAIPEKIGLFGGIISKDTFIMILFSILMIGASYTMIRNPENLLKNIKFSFAKNNSWLPMIFLGIFVGTLAGLVGAGGGFLIIPALVLFADLPMKVAIGTSLVIIAFNSFVGFFGDMAVDVDINWTFLSEITFMAVLGILVGMIFSRKISGQGLKFAFGWFILIMGVYIIINSYFF